MKTPSTFAPTWVSISLGDDRPADGTYGSWPYTSLPRLPGGWLGSSFAPLRAAPVRKKVAPAIDGLVESAKQRSLSVPPSFVEFFSSDELPSRVRSSTDCFFHVAKEVAVVNAKLGGFVRFYSDSQGLLSWYLHLHPAGGHVVVMAAGTGEHPDQKPAFVSSSFEAFMLRMWLENEIWYAHVFENTPLTKEQQEYLAHYRR